MKDPGIRNDPKAADLVANIAALTARVAALEHHLGLTAADPPSTPSAASSAAIPTPDLDQPPTSAAAASHTDLQLPSIGISFLMLAGAFLLRAVTDAGTLTATIGVSLGLAYILVLLFLTDRAARRGQRTPAHLFGSATVLVAYPFIWETTTKLGLLPPTGAVAVTALVIILGLGVMLRHRLQLVAWFMLLAAVTTCTGLYWTTDATVLFLALLVALGVATVWLGYLRNWQGPQWVVAIVANFLIFLTVMMAAHPARQAPGRPTPDPDGALLLAIALPVVYLASFSWRTLVQRREAGGFEIMQSMACLMAGYVGAIHLLHVGGRSTAALGWATLIAAVAGYVVAFMLVRSRQGRGLNFFYYAWLGLLLTFIGSALVVSGQWLPYLWCGLGVAAAITGGHFDRWTLRLHCAAYLVGAAVVTGLPAAIFAAFVAPQTPTWQDWTTPGVIVWLVTTVCYGLLVAAQRGRKVSRWRRSPRFLVATLALTGAGVLLVTALSVWLTGVISGPETGIVAAIRTAVLAGTAVLLAAVGRRQLFVELSWFTSPLLVLIAPKMLFEDLRQGTPISLFVGFACYGIALIVAPRLRRHKAHAASDLDPTSEGSNGTETT